MLIGTSQFQSTLPVRGATKVKDGKRQYKGISIHAPRAGSDFRECCRAEQWSHFNPRSPCGERRGRFAACRIRRDFNPRSPCGERQASTMQHSISLIFQSTLPVRGATTLIDDVAMLGEISIHAPRAGSDFSVRNFRIKDTISIHAPRAGSDTRVPHAPAQLPISIHAPRAGSDPQNQATRFRPCDFNPRSPCGERRRARRAA